MTTVAPFKPDRFASVVDEYVKYRTRYTPALYAKLATETGLTATSRVLDLGCGPGFIANGMAAFAGEVVGVDPDAAMLEAARGEAAGLANVRYVEGSSFDLSVAPGPYQLVTMGRSFHWMDRAATVVALDTMVSEGGVLALLGDRPVKGPGGAWYGAFNAVVRGYSVLDDCARYRYSDDWEPHEAVLERSAFSSLARVSVYVRQSWTPEALLGLAASRSASTPTLIGEKWDEMAAAVRAALTDHLQDGRVSALMEHTAVLARRP